MTDAKKVLTPECKEQIWTLADIDKLAYDFWAIHPRELDAWYKGDMPKDFKGGVRAWYFASNIRTALTAATERAERAEARVRVMEAALEPFAIRCGHYEPPHGDLADDTDMAHDCYATVGDLRAARAAKEQSE